MTCTFRFATANGQCSNSCRFAHPPDGCFPTRNREATHDSAYSIPGEAAARVGSASLRLEPGRQRLLKRVSDAVHSDSSLRNPLRLTSFTPRTRIPHRQSPRKTWSGRAYEQFPSPNRLAHATKRPPSPGGLEQNRRPPRSAIASLTGSVKTEQFVCLQQLEATPLNTATVLLIATDEPLISTVREVVDSIPNLRLDVRPLSDDVESDLPGDKVSLVLYHVTDNRQADRVSTCLRGVRATGRSLPALILSDAHVPGRAVAFLRLGAAEELSRPMDLNSLAYHVDALTVRARYAAGVAATAASRVATLGDGEAFLYSPEAEMGQVVEQVKRVAPQDTTILLTGETGTGKTSLARVIHQLSHRHGQPFLAVNCGALSANLLDSEMFGHVRGAFTGADRDRTGKFQQVGRGTLLLDEIDALPLALQAKLLRVVEERVFEPIGSNRSQRLDARLIVASNRQLEEEVTAGRFRSDLYYRFSVVGFHLQPLRERRHMIRPLAEQFIRTFAGAERPASPVDLPGGRAGAGGARLARQRPRGAERHRAGGRSLCGKGDRP